MSAGEQHMAISKELIKFYEQMKMLEKIPNGQEREGKKATMLIMSANDIQALLVDNLG